MESTLIKIQKFFKLGKIFSKIAYVLSLIGVIGCLIGGISLLVCEYGLKVDIASYIEKYSEGSIMSAYASIIVGLILSLGEVIVAKSSVNFYKFELETGTPFDLECAKKMRRLGIVKIVVPIIAIVLAAVVFGVMEVVFDGIGEINIGNYGSIGLGIAYIIASLLCRYGAEIQEK